MAKKGAYYEYQVMEMFEKYGYATLRTLGSGGGTKKPKPDVVASCGFRKKCYAIEIKQRNDEKLYINMNQMDELKTFSLLFGAVPLVIVKFGRKPFFVFHPDDINVVGENYKITYSQVMKKEKCMELDEFLKIDDVCQGEN